MPDPGAGLVPVSGVEWLVEGWGCDPEALRSPAALAGLFAQLIAEMSLSPIGEPLWHRFPGEGGVSGMVLLAESHLTCHSFPESGLVTLNLYCCRPRPEWPFRERLQQHLGASTVVVRALPRGEPPDRGSP